MSPLQIVLGIIKIYNFLSHFCICRGPCGSCGVCNWRLSDYGYHIAAIFKIHRSGTGFISSCWSVFRIFDTYCVKRCKSQKNSRKENSKYVFIMLIRLPNVRCIIYGFWIIWFVGFYDNGSNDDWQNHENKKDQAEEFGSGEFAGVLFYISDLEPAFKALGDFIGSANLFVKVIRREERMLFFKFCDSLIYII